MPLKRYSTSVDGTIPVPALLYEDEVVLTSQEGVGIYDGSVSTRPPQKSVHHQAGTIHATTHRLFYIDNAHPFSRSFSFDLVHVARTEHYAGLFTSSAKVTLYLNPRPPKFEATGIAEQNTQPIQLSSAFSTDGLHRHPLLRECEICGTPLPRKPSMPLPQASHPPAKSAPASRSATPAPEDEDSDDENDSVEKRMIRLSFRKGGDKPFYTVLRRSLLGRAWESKAVARPTPSSSKGIGISGILRSVETTAQVSQTNMEDALEDLEALMIKWKDMVKLAQDLNERLTAVSAPAPVPGITLPGLSSPSSPSPSPAGGLGTTASGTAMAMAASRQVVEPEEATFIRSSLAQLGLQMANAPVTQDMVLDERKWFEELARELAGVLEGSDVGPSAGNGRSKGGEGMMRRRGIIALDEVWGGWNRARGVALIPPSTFLRVLPYLPSFTLPPIRMRTFPSSGLSVLHTPPFGRATFAARLVGLLILGGPRTTIEVAQEEDLPIGLTQEMLDEVETDGEICRDDGGSGVDMFSESLGTEGGTGGEVRYWINIFRGYVWDGQE
uniref:Vacuolar protein-sorting-associated protein 36 n=1 Tax=Ganoderma boninense TaxID=34458 RepID=A0A5K1JWX3_9APHY|nr:Mst12 [Ganoderma boninense]